MKSLKNILSLSLAVLISAAAAVPAFADTYFEADHFEFMRNDDLSITISGYDDSSENMVIPSLLVNHEVVAIDSTAFYGDTVIKSAELPDTITSIGDSAFYKASNLTTVNIPVNCSDVGDCVFRNCTSLESVTIESNLTEISLQLFQDCSALPEITLPETVEKINTYAFAGCSSLERIYIPAATQTISLSAFKDVPNVTIYGYRNTYANTYADEKGIPFIALDDIDNSALADALTKANAILNDKNSPYTAESIENLRSVVASALEVYNSKFSVQEEIDKAASDVQTAISALVIDLSDCIYGDVDLDGIVTVDDVTEIQCYLANYFDFNAKQSTASDVNLDGVTDITDATLIQCYLAMYDVANVGEPVSE